MPDIKHYFRSGKMNKDLDERLVPNGEYRDALNIEMSTSDGDDVGTIQNVIGTSKVIGKTYDSNKKLITANWSGSSFGLTNAVCVGTKLNNESDTIYWFIASTEASCIAEYSAESGVIRPVLVDTEGILGWTRETNITGINIIEDLLIWTDDETEPKKINIKIFKSGCYDNFTNHTKYTGKIITPFGGFNTLPGFQEEHITVAKKAPMGMPTLTMSASTRGGNGTGTNSVIASNAVAQTFTNTENESHPAGTLVNLYFSPLPNFQVNDIITLTTIYEELGQQETFEIKVLVMSISSTNVHLCRIQSIPVELPYTQLTWEAVLSEEGVLFEKKFVRFAYRWKYYSGEYSTFSPFSETAFLPDTFEYLSTDGYNNGMINNLRQLTINITESRPIDVEEVEILYKESNNNNIYVVDTLKHASDGTFPTEYKLESEIISKTVESNQIIRPWDNVPRKAKAQEVTANRLIFGNYLQNYDILDTNLPNITMSISQGAITTIREPQLSIKSLRTYQVGVVYIDKYNRQSPVFTSDKASRQTGKNYAPTVNSINVTLNNQPPSWATHFKYYIKETSNEYYNLAMDRYYLAEDGNVWLSFPSSERNKVDEETYLILKKKHDSDEFVSSKSRYKILDISNDAPDFLKLKQKAIATGAVKARSSGIPQIGSIAFTFLGPNPQTNPSFGEGFSSDAVIQIANGGIKSDKYNVISGGPTGDTEGNAPFNYIYQVTLEEPIKTGDTMVSGISAGDEFEVILFEEKFERKAEFYGRFFVKVNRDSNFDTNIIASFPEEDEQFGIIESRTIYGNAQNTGAGSNRQEASWYDTADRRRSRWVRQENNGHPRMGEKKMTFYFCGSPKSDERNFDKSNTINNFLKLIELKGTIFRFKGSQSGELSPLYEVTKNAQEDRTYRYRRTSGKKYQSAKRRQYNIKFEKRNTSVGMVDNFSYPTSGNPVNYISEIQIMQNVITADVDVLTSSNPAVWETEPKETVDLDLYYETGLSRPISQHGSTHVLDFKNCYSFGNGVESDRINDDYNAPRIGKGVKVSAVLDEPYREERKKTGLIFSGIFNSTSGVNRLNQFIQGEAITKDMNPHYGSIQKLHSRNTDLIVLCEDKCLKVLANKDALFEAGGNPQLTATNRVLGQTIPFIGEYGISKNPESFASYAYRCYFTDKSRGVVLRLSRDGLTAISENGMRDFFKDILPTGKKIIGSYDGSKGLYNLTLNHKTISFDEKVNGFPSFKSFLQEGAVSLNNVYYSIYLGELYSHDNTVRNNFYGLQYDSSVTFLINEMPEVIKGFKTLNYGGSASRKWTGSNHTDGWYCDYINTDTQQGFIKEFKRKEGRYYNNIKGEVTTLANLDSKEFNVQGIGQFLSISGDVSLGDKTLIVELTGIDNSTSPLGRFDVEAGTEIHSEKQFIDILITPDTGSTLTAGDLSFNASGHTYVNSVAFTQSGLNVSARVNFKDGVNMPSSNLTISLAIVGDGVLNKYILKDLSIVDQSDTNVVATITYNGSGNNETANPVGNQLGYKANYGTNNTVAVVKFNLNNAYNFRVAPSFEITAQDNDPESYYTITYQDKLSTGADFTIGDTVSGVVTTLDDVDQRWYTIQYTFPAQDTLADSITFSAESVLENNPDVNKITGYNVVGGNVVSRFAQDKEVKIFGAVGADFRLKNSILGRGGTSGSSSVFTLATANYDIKKGMKITGSGISGTVTVLSISGTNITMTSAQTISSNTTLTFTHWWNGTTFVGTETDLEIPSTGMYPVNVPFFETSVTRRYYLEIEAISPTALLPISPSSAGDPVLQGNVYNSSNVVQNPFYINQYVDVSLTLGMHQTGSDFTITSNDVSKTYLANSYPDENSNASLFDLVLTATATGNITKIKDPEIEDWSNYLSTDSEEISTFQNGFELDYETPIISINNTANPKTITITGNMLASKYGTTNLVSDLAINNFASVSGGSSGSNQSRLWTPTVTGGGGFIMGAARASYNDGNGNSGTNDKGVAIGTLSLTSITSGTGTIYGNFYGNSINDITLTISVDSGGTSALSSSQLTVAKGTLTQVDPSSYNLTFTWSGRLDEVIDASSLMVFNVHVALANEP